MGALHQGHCRLIKAAQKKCDVVVVSIFVNPLQFDERSDFENYPRNLNADLQLLNEWSVDAAYTPDESSIYPPDRNIKLQDPGAMGQCFEGACRPGHFAGMLTVVHELFSQVQPNHAFFGEKDAQQLSLVQELAKRMANAPIINPVPTARQASGLAMSSRNRRLSAIQQQSASAIFRALIAAQDFCQRDNFELPDVESEMQHIMHRAGLEVEYATVVNSENFEPLNENQIEQHCSGDSILVRAIVAARIGGVRLIDNLLLNKN